MQLIIAEKKELAEDISKAIPGTKNNKGLQIEAGDYVICWVGGHILKLKDPEDINPELKKWQLEKLPIYFEKWEKSIIKNKSSLFKNLKEFVEENNYEVTIVGHTDSVGSNQYNFKLSKKRAEAVKAKLLEFGLAEDRILGIEAMGEEEPIASNDTKEGRAENRRVEFKLIQRETPANKELKK